MTNTCPCCRNIVERVETPGVPQFEGFCSERCQSLWETYNTGKPTPRQAEQMAAILNDRNHHLERMWANEILHNSHQWVFVVDDENNAVACARVRPTEMYWSSELVRLAVRKDYEGEGLGPVILSKAEQTAKDNGVLVLLATVREDNFGAKVLFYGAKWHRCNRFFSPTSGKPVEVWMKTMREVTNDND